MGDDRSSIWFRIPLTPRMIQMVSLTIALWLACFAGASRLWEYIAGALKTSLGPVPEDFGLIFPILLACVSAYAFNRGELPFSMASAREREDGIVLADWYARDLAVAASPPCTVLFISVAFLMFERDYIAGSVTAFIALGILGFSFLTKFRATHGWFADNGYEALELLNFVISKHEKDESPPGARVDQSSSEMIAAKKVTSDDVAGARA
jgi:hypothetical protein